MRSIIAVMVFGLMLSSCGQGSSDAIPGDPQVKRYADPVVMAERRALGRWKSASGVLPGAKNVWVIFDIAGSKDIQAEVRGMSSRREAVYAIGKGKVQITDTGITGTLDRPSSSLWLFRDFKASFPNTSTMIVVAGDGRKFTFNYDGA